jgi:hypothetical protein
MTTYRTCHHIHDTGGTCASAAVKNQNYCAFHLNHRARLMRMAQYRSRNQRFAFYLPPLENMHAVCSALNQLSEAATAGVIDLKQARFLLSVVRAAGQFLLRAGKWPATSVVHSDHSAAEIDLAVQYGLPQDLNLDLSPEAAFPQFPEVGAPSFSTASAGERVGTGHQPLAAGHSLSEMPFSGNYCGYHHSRECECCRIRADYPVTPESVEVVEVYEKYGEDLASVRGRQLERNRQGRQLRNERKRYEAIALERNMRRAAELMADRKLAERAKSEEQVEKSEERIAKKAAAPPLSTAIATDNAGLPLPKKPSASVSAEHELLGAGSEKPS